MFGSKTCIHLFYVWWARYFEVWFIKLEGHNVQGSIKPEQRLQKYYNLLSKSNKCKDEQRSSIYNSLINRCNVVAKSTSCEAGNPWLKSQLWHEYELWQATMKMTQNTRLLRVCNGLLKTDLSVWKPVSSNKKVLLCFNDLSCTILNRLTQIKSMQSHLQKSVLELHCKVGKTITQVLNVGELSSRMAYTTLWWYCLCERWRWKFTNQVCIWSFSNINQQIKQNNCSPFVSS